MRKYYTGHKTNHPRQKHHGESSHNQNPYATVDMPPALLVTVESAVYPYDEQQDDSCSGIETTRCTPTPRTTTTSSRGRSRNEIDNPSITLSEKRTGVSRRRQQQEKGEDEEEPDSVYHIFDNNHHVDEEKEDDLQNPIRVILDAFSCFACMGTDGGVSDFYGDSPNNDKVTEEEEDDDDALLMAVDGQDQKSCTPVPVGGSSSPPPLQRRAKENEINATNTKQMVIPVASYVVDPTSETCFQQERRQQPMSLKPGFFRRRMSHTSSRYIFRPVSEDESTLTGSAIAAATASYI